MSVSEHRRRERAERAEELAEERDFLLRSLQDLDQERAAGELDEADYVTLRDRYVARAAVVLRALEEAATEGETSRAGAETAASETIAPGTAVAETAATETAASETAAAETAAEAPATVSRPARASGARRSRRGRSGPAVGPVHGRRPRWRQVVAVVAVAGLAVGAGTLVASSSGERLPGEQVSGSVPAGSAERLALARAHIGEGEVLKAIKLYDQVLRDDPRQPEALAYKGWLLSLAGLSERGLPLVDQALAADPTYPDARFFRGMILYRYRQDPAAAVPEFRAFLANDPPPEMVAMVEETLRQALADSGQSP